jgi:glycine/D-amino acid oxidase-like deaminating enzyme
MVELAALMQQASHKVDLLDADAVRREVRSPTYLAGLWDRTGWALVEPARLAWGLRAACLSLGVRIHEGSPVLRLDDDSPHVRVMTGAGSVRADMAALATNAFPPLLRRLRLMTVPVYDYVLATEPLNPTQLASIGWQNRQGVGDTANMFHYYRLTRDHRIVWGGYDAVYHYGSRIDRSLERRTTTHQLLAQHFFTTFPQLAGVRFTHRWAGVIDTSTRFAAFFGTALRGRVAYALGYTGLGVAATRFGADVMLDRLWSEDTERTRLRMVGERPLPFPPEPLRFAGIQLTRWSMARADQRGGRRNLWLRGLDRLGLGFDS